MSYVAFSHSLFWPTDGVIKRKHKKFYNPYIDYDDGSSNAPVMELNDYVDGTY
jgi:hypothetical protein